MEEILNSSAPLSTHLTTDILLIGKISYTKEFRIIQSSYRPTPSCCAPFLVDGPCSMRILHARLILHRNYGMGAQYTTQQLPEWSAGTMVTAHDVNFRQATIKHKLIA